METDIHYLENKTCSKGHINPPEALYCRICSEPLKLSDGKFTPDLYPHIHLAPASIKKIKFLKWGEILSFVILPIGLVLCCVFGSEFERFLDLLWDGEPGPFVLVVLAFLLVIGALRGLIHCLHSLSFKFNVDFIEETEARFARVAKNGKLGLFDQKKNRLLIPPRYVKVDTFGDNHILIGQDRFVGLYSIPHKRIIVPVECDSISPVKEGVIKVLAKGTVRHFDIVGNELH